MPPEEKLLAGEELFDYACAITLAGIRDQFRGPQRGGMLADSRREIGFARTNGAAAMTAGESITLRVAEALEACGIPFLLSGSFASNFYGIPRSTRDADFVLQAAARRRAGIRETIGRRLPPRPQLSFETNTGTFASASPQEEGVQGGAVPAFARCSRSVPLSAAARRATPRPTALASLAGGRGCHQAPLGSRQGQRRCAGCHGRAAGQARLGIHRGVVPAARHPGA